MSYKCIYISRLADAIDYGLCFKQTKFSACNYFPTIVNSLHFCVRNELLASGCPWDHGGWACDIFLFKSERNVSPFKILQLALVHLLSVNGKVLGIGELADSPASICKIL